MSVTKWDRKVNKLVWFLLNKFGSEELRKKHEYNPKPPKPDSELKKFLDKEFPDGTVYYTYCMFCSKEIRNEVVNRETAMKRYCSKSHRDRQRVRTKKYKEEPRECPRPDKASFPDGVSTQRYLTLLVREKPDLILNNVYACRCGRYHIGKVKLWKRE